MPLVSVLPWARWLRGQDGTVVHRPWELAVARDVAAGGQLSGAVSLQHLSPAAAGPGGWLGLGLGKEMCLGLSLEASIPLT